MPKEESKNSIARTIGKMFKEQSKVLRNDLISIVQEQTKLSRREIEQRFKKQRQEIKSDFKAALEIREEELIKGRAYAFKEL